jgi:hypothetical protein
MIPSGYSPRVLYTVIPNNTIGDFTFVRSGNATRINKDGLIETVDSHVPRLNYDLVNGVPSQCPSLLLEPQSTNLVTNSITGAYGNPPASEINTTAPDGTITAIIPVPNSTADRYEYSISGGTYATDTKLTYSWYSKQISQPSSTYVGNLIAQALTNATQVGINIKVKDSINGWAKYSATFNITDGSASTVIRLYFGSVVGVGNQSVAYWGHQLEALSYCTSLITTSGSIASRSAEACNSAGNASTFNSEQGILFAEFSYLQNGFVSINDGSNTNRIFLGFSGGQVYAQVRVNLSVNADMLYGSFSQNTIVKAAIKYKTDDFALWVNGVERATDNSGSIFPINTINELSFDNGASNPFYGNTKDLRYYDTEGMSDTEITNLLTQLTQ